ncbi:Gfo/Idh/MocA family oxidoreductase [Candidatus Poseidoniaceae archaeon]|nr:Gfo/Idh/MocA family oxidoreductase [Candidatus Poseidoniaceae archaeon]
MSKIRWGIVGAARVNERLMPAIIHSTDGELVAIGSRRPGAAKECLLKYAPDLEDQVQCFDGLDQVINHERVDAVYIPLANEEHVPTALKAIRAKKHVLIEKPMAIKSKEVKILIEAASKNNVKIMEGFMYAFHPQFDRIMNTIKSNILGDINYAHSMFSFPIQPARFYRINRSMENGGGALWDIGPYAIHTIRQCFKENPIRVKAISKLNEHGADISTTGLIDFGNNKRASFDIGFECTRRSEFEAFGPLGRVKCPTVWQPEDKQAKIIINTEKGGLTEEVVPAANHFILEVNHFNKIIGSDISPKLSKEDALWNAKTLESIEQSIKVDSWVNL